MRAEPYICIIDIRTGVVHHTDNEGLAARLLVPGTTYGKGWSKKQAEQQAGARREFHLQQG